MENNNKPKKDPRTEPEVRPTLAPFRSLDNYKKMQVKVAENKGRLEQLLAAPTLTAARRIVYGK